MFKSIPISIVMPAYNAEKYISSAIDSVLAQTYQDWELLVVNDGSTDRTPELIQTYANKDQRIRLFTIPNGRQAKARNFAISQARFEWIAFLDADDLWMPDKLEKQVKQLIEDPSLDMIFSTGYIFEEGKTYSENKVFASVYSKFNSGQIAPLLFESNKIAILSVLILKSLIVKAGGFDEKCPCEDYDLWLKITSQNAYFYGMEEKLFRYRVHSQASSRNQLLKIQMEMKTILEASAHVPVGAKKKVKRMDNLRRQKIKHLLKSGRIKEAKEELGKIFSHHPVNKTIRLVLSSLMSIHPNLYRLMYEPLYQLGYYFK